MRKLIVIALLATGMSACASGTPSTAPTSAAAGDTASATACDEARAATTAAIAELQAIYVDTGGVAPSDPQKQQVAMERSQKAMNTWIDTFTELANGDVTPEVKQALTNSVAAITSLLGRLTSLTPMDGLATINEVTTNLDAACTAS